VSSAEVVVDASLALKWVVEEPYSAEAHALLNRWRESRRALLAPALFLYEITNALAKRMQRRQLTLEQSRIGCGFFLKADLCSNRSA
jgi:predicted nucleic acid-binding protein